MYFQIENTPEHIRRARRVQNVPKESPKEESPRLVLAPFSRPPQVVFENVLIGSTCERVLEVLNPLKQPQQITLGKALPPGLVIQLPGEWMVLEPESCYELLMMWTPTQPTAMRETIRFTNENRGRYDVIVVLKSTMNIKGKNGQPKLKTSPGKMKKKKVQNKKSPVAIYKKKAEIIYNTTTKVQKTVNVVQHRVYQTYDKENFSGIGKIDYSLSSNQDKCPFGSPSSVTNFDTSEIFADMRKTNILQDTYEKSPMSNTNIKPDVHHNVLRVSNKQNYDSPTADIFENLTFTPLKSNAKVDKLNKGPKVIISVNSESELDDSLDIKLSNKENDTHSIMTITTSQQQTNWVTHAQAYNQIGMETVTLPIKKHPNTSSPKELNSPNFSINTDFSRISDLSFYPQRFSTERKCFTKANETHELLNDKVSSDTYTKDSPNAPMDYGNQHYQAYERPPHYFNREQPKMCRQSLFREYQMQREAYDRNYMSPYDHNPWHNELKADARSPPRSITPPLQSIPEESTQFSHTQILDKTDNQMATFTIDKTFDKTHDKSSMSTRQTWSKKNVRVEPDVWKVPVVAPARKSTKLKAASKPKESLDGKIANLTFESNKSINQNITVNQIGNVYSQTATVDPFLSATYFYDEEAVHKFENEFKRWLNCILTPPADLESNEDQKLDLGKAWIESRNKEVPLAPTKEQVSSAYHNSHRLASLRRSARSLLMSNEMAQVFQKLNAQIEKKLITIRTDRNLHMDVGLQKIIMEIILSYNPLWLRIGLEAIYGIVLPLKSNSDIEGLTSFIIQRMFKNPFLKNKNSKSSVPNMLLPAYMEAIKKFTLKKFFMLVYFLDQAKQRRLISHDPCLFCRNAICKESREIIIRFTRELIAGIGDITRHLRPLGYVVTHKQSYLDEYKYAVHNLALDIRDGVRLTKVMEIIMMKNGLLQQLRTPAISRLQKIHNVQVAMNALKEANFVIDGEITATDIADGHREKTLSLLWQIIHVYRAPLFVKAANVIQTWWRKKYEVIVQKRKEEQRILKINNAAITITKFIRSYVVTRRLRQEFITIRKSTIVIQRYFRTYLLAKYQRRKYMELRMATILMQRRFRSLRIMKIERKSYVELRNAVIRVQAQYRAQVAMRKEKEQFLKLKLAVIAIQQRYRALIHMRVERSKYIEMKSACIKIQTAFRAYRLGKPYRQHFLKQKEATLQIQRWYRSWKKVHILKQEYLKAKQSCVTIQRYYRAFIVGRRERQEYIRTKNATVCLQRFFRSYIKMKTTKQEYMKIKTSTVIIQRFFRSFMETSKKRQEYLRMKSAVACIENTYKRYKEYQTVRKQYLQLRETTTTVQRIYRSIIAMRQQRTQYLKLKQSAIAIQQRFRANLSMRVERQSYLKLRSAVVTVQTRYRAQTLMKQERLKYVTMQKACISIQRYFRAYVLGKKMRFEYLKMKSAAVVLQTRYKALLAMRIEKSAYQIKKNATVTIQRRWRAKKLMMTQRNEYRNILKACQTIQNRFRAYIAGQKQRTEYLKIKMTVIFMQSRVRMMIKRKSYLRLRSAAITLQTLYRAQCLMKLVRSRYITMQKASVLIQRHYRAHTLGKKTRINYLKLKESAIALQSRYRALLAMRKQRSVYISHKKAATVIQKRWRANKQMKTSRQQYVKTINACKTIQSHFRAYIARKKQRAEYLKLKTSVVLIQKWYRLLTETRKVRRQYLQLKNAIITIQRSFRAKQVKQNEAARKIQAWYRSVQKRDICRNEYLVFKKHVITVQAVVRMHIIRKQFIQIRTATTTIQRFYRSYKLTVQERQRYMCLRSSIITLQSYVRKVIARKRYLRVCAAARTIQLAYKLKRRRDIERKRRENAAVTIQKHVRRCLIQSKYRIYREKVLFVQRIWRGRLLTRLMQCEYQQKRRFVIKLQAIARGYLIRREVQMKKEHIVKVREMQRQNWAASKVQALFRGNSVRTRNVDPRVVEIRRRWRAGKLKSIQPTLSERNKEALQVLRYYHDIIDVIKAFRTIELISEVYPMTYSKNAAAIVARAFVYMSTTNRSISSVEVLKYAASFVVNLARYKVTGPKIYNRDHIEPILRYMWRFVNSEKQLFCIFATYLWLCSKYDTIKQDLTEFLHIPEHHKIMVTIKNNVNRTKRMEANTRNVFLTPQSCRKNHSHTMNMSTMNTCLSSCSNSSLEMPSLEPDFGICSMHSPRYFEDPQHAINCLFKTYNL